MDSNPAVVLVGAGYVGTALARGFARRGRKCLAVVSSTRSEARLADLDIDSARRDLDDAGISVDLPNPCSIVYLVPPSRTADADERLHRFLEQLDVTVTALVYVSTSGVYGDHGGRLIDETATVAPHSARARRRLDAERQIAAFGDAGGSAWTIARVPGIYGPGRLPLQGLREGRPIIRVGEANPGNRIHRDDLAAALADLTEHTERRLRESAGQIYNCGDNNYMSSSQFTLEVARMTGLAEPPQISREAMKAAASSVRWSFLAESRRLDSRRLHGVLSAPLRYSNPVLGIRASLDAPDDPAA